MLRIVFFALKQACFFIWLFCSIPGRSQCVMKATLTIEPVYGPAHFVIGDKAYFPCGWFTGTKSINEQATYVYNSTLDKWSQVANFPAEGRATAVGFSVGGKGYVTFGSWSNIGWYNALWEYDPQTDKWTQRASVPSVGRDFPISFSLNGYGYVGTGRQSDSLHVGSDLWRYDPINDSWTKMQSVPGVGRILSVAMTINGKAYVGMGMTAESPSSDLNDFYEFDPIQNTWKMLKTSPLKGGCFASFAIKNKGYVDRNLDGFWEYDASSDSWKKLSDCVPHYGSCMNGFSIYDKGYFAFGSYGNWQQPNQLFEYSPPELTGVNETDQRLITLFPNPATDKIYFNLTIPVNSEAFIYDHSGRIVKQLPLSSDHILVTDLLPGIYHLAVRDGEKRLSARFVKD